MSRYKDWTNAWAGINHYLTKNGIIPDNNKVDNVRFWVDKYCNRMKFKGSRTDRILFVNENWKQFKIFVDNAGQH